MELGKVLKALAAGAVCLASQQAIGQPVTEEIIVSGRFGRVPDSVQSLSQPVSYADLDLTLAADRQELRRRLNLTARFLCEKMGETDTSPGIAPSCRNAAVRDATSRVGTVEEKFAPRGTTWVRPSRWAAPYPVEWYTRYP